MGKGFFGTPEGPHPHCVCRPRGIAASDFAARTCHRHVLCSPLTLTGFESLRAKGEQKKPSPKWVMASLARPKGLEFAESVLGLVYLGVSRPWRYYLTINLVPVDTILYQAAVNGKGKIKGKISLTFITYPLYLTTDKQYLYISLMRDRVLLAKNLKTFLHGC